MSKRMLKGLSSTLNVLRSPLRHIGLPKNSSTPFSKAAKKPTTETEDLLGPLDEHDESNTSNVNSPITDTTNNNNNENIKDLTNSSLNISSIPREYSSTPETSLTKKRKYSLSLTFNSERRAKWRKLQREKTSSDMSVVSPTLPVSPTVIDLTQDEPDTMKVTEKSLDTFPTAAAESLQTLFPEMLEIKSNATLNFDNFPSIEDPELFEMTVMENKKEDNTKKDSKSKTEEIIELPDAIKDTTSIEKDNETKEEEMIKNNVTDTPEEITETKSTKQFNSLDDIFANLSNDSLSEETDEPCNELETEELNILREKIEEKRNRVQTLKNHIKRTRVHSELTEQWKDAGIQVLKELADEYGDYSANQDIIGALMSSLNIPSHIFGYNHTSHEFE